MTAGIGQTNHSDAGPNQSTIALATTPMAMPNTNRFRRNGNSNSPYEKNDRPKIPLASAIMTTSPMALVMTLDATRPATYSGIDNGLAKRFRKLRDHTSSR